MSTCAVLLGRLQFEHSPPQKMFSYLTYLQNQFGFDPGHQSHLRCICIEWQWHTIVSIRPLPSTQMKRYVWKETFDSETQNEPCLLLPVPWRTDDRNQSRSALLWLIVTDIPNKIPSLQQAVTAWARNRFTARALKWGITLHFHKCLGQTFFWCSNRR